MKRWKYMFVEMPVNQGQFIPDKFGKAGWELIAVVAASGSIDRMWFKKRLKKKKKNGS